MYIILLHFKRVHGICLMVVVYTHTLYVYIISCTHQYINKCKSLNGEIEKMAKIEWNGIYEYKRKKKRTEMKYKKKEITSYSMFFLLSLILYFDV